MEPFVEERMKICRECALFKRQGDGNHRCDGTKYLDVETNQTSYLPKRGLCKGCSCLIEIKTTNPSAKCVCGKG